MREDVAEQRLVAALAEQERLTTRYHDSAGTSGEVAAYLRLQAATRTVANCDRALVAARCAATERFSFVVLSGLDGPRDARVEVARRIRGLVDPDVAGDVALLVSEVVTNAVKHGATSDVPTVTVTGEISDDTLRIVVVNTGEPFEAHPTAPDERDPGGRGLFLVDLLSRTWGSGHADGDTSVWFELERDRARLALAR